MESQSNDSSANQADSDQPGQQSQDTAAPGEGCPKNGGHPEPPPPPPETENNRGPIETNANYAIVDARARAEDQGPSKPEGNPMAPEQEPTGQANGTTAVEVHM